ncbi:MAG: hypothetical protein RL381_198 [Actinomycetota bacterium]|jgi:hypothetical protein
MKRIIAFITIGFLAISISGANAATKVTVLNQNSVSKKNPVVTLKVSGLPQDHGIYVIQCMAPDKAKTAPTSCNPSETGKLWISNVASDQKMGAKSGTGKITMKVDKYFKGGDCLHTTCVLYVKSDHNAPSDRSEDQWIPFKFGGFKF